MAREQVERYYQLRGCSQTKEFDCDDGRKSFQVRSHDSFDRENDHDSEVRPRRESLEQQADQLRRSSRQG